MHESSDSFSGSMASGSKCSDYPGQDCTPEELDSWLAAEQIAPWEPTLRGLIYTKHVWEDVLSYLASCDVHILRQLNWQGLCHTLRTDAVSANMPPGVYNAEDPIPEGPMVAFNGDLMLFNWDPTLLGIVRARGPGESLMFYLSPEDFCALRQLNGHWRKPIAYCCLRAGFLPAPRSSRTASTSSAGSG